MWVLPQLSRLLSPGSNLALLPRILRLWVPPAHTHEPQSPDFSLCSLFLITLPYSACTRYKSRSLECVFLKDTKVLRGSVIELSTQGWLLTGPAQILPCASVSSLCTKVCPPLTAPPTHDVPQRVTDLKCSLRVSEHPRLRVGKRRGTCFPHAQTLVGSGPS